MATASLPNTIIAGTPAVAAEVQGNDEYLEGFLNAQVAHVDGTKPFTAIPSTTDVSAPSSDGQLVSLGGLKAYNRILAFREHPTTSLNMDDGAIADSGISLPSFTMPTLGGGRYLEITATIPQITMYAHGGDTPDPQMQLQAFLRHGSVVVGYAATLQGVTLGLGIDSDAPTLHVRQILASNTKIAAGTTVNIKLEGRPARTGGRMQFLGTADAPIQLMAELKS